MHRRRLLRLSGLAAAGSIAGCTGEPAPEGETEGTKTDGEPTPVRSVDDVELPVPAGELEQRLAKDTIPAIVDPAFGTDWSGLETDDGADMALPDDAPVIGVERDGDARAYPLRILNWHEIVNDGFDVPVAVTYCVLCGSAVVVERTVEGEPTIFGVSGALWRNDLVMYDRATESLWSQLLATAIRGERTGERLQILPSSLTTWGEWATEHPDTRVLLPPPESNTVSGHDATYSYDRSKYNYGGEDQLIGYDEHLDERRLVIGVETETAARAYPFDVVSDAEVINDTVGELPVVVTVLSDGTMAAYVRRVAGRTVAFEPDGAATLRGADSTWDRSEGRAIDGPHEGERLERANDHPPMFWVGWRNFNPGTDTYGADLGDGR